MLPPDPLQREDVRDGMRVLWDAPIPMDDGVVLRADVFMPTEAGRYPVILSMGPYGKGLAFQDGNKAAWDRLVKAHPEVALELLPVVVKRFRETNEALIGLNALRS